jgi:hypothetical protein
VAAIVSAWLPWISSSGQSAIPMDATDMSDLACGYYLLIGGGVAAACGLLLLLRIVSGPSMPVLFGIGAIAGGILVVAAEVVAYGHVSDVINLSNSFGADSGVAIGFGLYVGIGAGVAAALGGLLAMANRR